MSLQTIGMFWDGDPLGLIEKLCITSFRDAGHPVVVFSYSGVEGLPDGIETASASDILPIDGGVIQHERTGSPAPQADKFRYHLLSKNDGMIWCDTDAYCLKPFEPVNGYFFGREGKFKVANGVMAIPASSPTLASLIAFCEDEYAIPPWMAERHVTEMEARAAAGDPMHVSEMAWGAWGPKAFSHYLRENNEFDLALPEHVLYPVPYENRRCYFFDASKVWQMVREDTVSIHFYGRRVRELLQRRYDGVPPPQSVVAELLQKHGIDY